MTVPEFTESLLFLISNNVTIDDHVTRNKIYQAFRKSKSMIILGNGGTGKSRLVETLLETAKEQGKRTLLLAPTGIAAKHVNGKTVHQQFNIKPSEVITRYDIESSDAFQSLRRVDTIIIDEISMLRCDLADYVFEQVRKANALREESKPIQLVLVGDFLQLTPVINYKNGVDKKLEEACGYEIERGCFFDNEELFKRFDFELFMLETVFRQENPVLRGELDMLRKGDVNCVPYFNLFVGKENHYYDESIIHIVATNKEKNEINNMIISKHRKDKKYKEFKPLFDNKYVEEFDDVGKYEPLRIFPGMKVIITDNDNKFDKIVNGQRGVVKDIFTEKYPIREEDKGEDEELEKEVKMGQRYVIKITDEDGKEKDIHRMHYEDKGYSQFPLKPCYAITVHKAQGQTFEKAVIHSGIRNENQLYVAFSRVTSPEGIILMEPIKEKDIQVYDPVPRLMQLIGEEKCHYVGKEAGEVPGAIKEPILASPETAA
ncbi:MAG: AAA family ATPase [Bacteroidaceae bacterium]|nr:AAA family ATPase [Bacteroidaceae bacterium]